MKKWLIGWGIVLLCLACMEENDCPCLKNIAVDFEMLDIPYVLEGKEEPGYRPYYVLTNRLDILAFRGTLLDTTAAYGYDYCREHPLIPFPLRAGSYELLFVANLSDHRALSWDFEGNRLQVMFRLVDHEEPPVYLADRKAPDVYEPIVLPVALRMLVARLEVEIVNPPAWVKGVKLHISRIAASMTLDGTLRDTSSIDKEVEWTHTGEGSYGIGVNTFPTYLEEPALVDVQLQGNNRADPLIIDDDRIHFVPGKIIRLSVVFESENRVSVSVEVDGKWEVIDEGEIII